MFVNTAACNKESYIKHKIKAAEQVREIYSYLGYPSVKDYKWVI